MSQLPRIRLLLHKAVCSGDNPAGGDDGPSTDMPSPPVQADLPPPLILSRQRSPDNTPPVANQKWAVCVWVDKQHKGPENIGVYKSFTILLWTRIPVNGHLAYTLTCSHVVQNC